MNERIRELESQCWEAKQYGPPWFNSTKFAELIVRECASICEDTEGDPSADSRWGRRCCALEIREHFGVGE
jgi:hypothetical protein